MMRLLLLTTLSLLAATATAGLAQDGSNHHVDHQQIRSKESPGAEHRLSRRLSSNSNSADDDDAAATDDDETSIQDRVKEDYLNMWGSPPNEWITEYWEVLGGTLAAVFCILAILLACCCLPLVTPREPKKRLQGSTTFGNNPAGAAVSPDNGTPLKKEMSSDRDALGKPILDDAATTDKSATTATTVTGAQTLVGIDSGLSSTLTPAPRPKRKRESFWSQRRAIWGEVVSVWSEFLGCTDQESYDGAKLGVGPKKASPRKYKAPSEVASTRNKSSRRSRRASGGRNSGIEYEGNASAEKQHKVGKYDGMVV